MSNLYRSIALSDHWAARLARCVYRYVMTFSVPAPRVLTRPILATFLLLRATYYVLARVFVCEPLFKAYCTRYGKNLRTGSFLHWVQGQGELIIGDNVVVDGRCSFFFAARYTERPTMTIGDHTGIGHNCAFTVGKRIAIGRHCRIATSVQMFDSPAHPADPAERLKGMTLSPDEVQPITVGDNVWIGASAIIMPGVTIGDGSIVAMSAVVMNSVPPNTLVAGNPARQVRSLVKSPPGAGGLEEVVTKKHA
jgi:acetyltransferase-like isoleucine patch superfamily enzyme